MSHLEQHRPRPDWRTYLAAYERAWRHFAAHPDDRTLAVLQTGEEILVRELFKPGRFELGQIVMTPGARDAMAEAGHVPPEFLLRHKHGDWGDLDGEDRRANEDALRAGGRLLSRYATRRRDRLWVLTEWDRSVTTLLLPEEY